MKNDKHYRVSFWLKRYDNDNRLYITRDIDDRDFAFKMFKTFSKDGRHYFVQMGAVSEDGSIVLNEFRPASA